MAKPNFLFVFIDDMGYADLGCFGGTRAKTPQVDRLAREGIRFTKFYVNSPICSPSRVAVTTGQYPQRWGITSYLAHRKENHRRGMKNWLSPDAPSLARILRDAGYHTAHVGKWHMGGQRDVGDAPRISAYGFDASITNFEGLGERVLPLFGFNHEPTLTSARLGGGPVRWVDREKVSEIFCDRAIEEMNRAAAAGKPFYINLWPDDVHSPFFPPKELRADGSKRALYEGVLANMDAQLGPLFDAVRSDPELRQNTLILLMSDNGHEPGAGSPGSFRGHQGTLYEGGVRAPLIVWSGGLIADRHKGRTVEQPVVSSVDLVPSLLRLAKVAAPAGVRFDGSELSSTLLGANSEGRRQALFWKRPPDRPGPPGGRFPDLAVREGKWKLLTRHDGAEPQLYDLDSDPQESKNLTAEQPEVTDRLKRRLLEWNAGLPEG